MPVKSTIRATSRVQKEPRFGYDKFQESFNAIFASLVDQIGDEQLASDIMYAGEEEGSSEKSPMRLIRDGFEHEAATLIKRRILEIESAELERQKAEERAKAASKTVIAKIF